MAKKRKSIQIITDPLLDPFFITKDEYSFAIKQTVKSDPTHFRSKGKSKEYEKTLCYHSTFSKTLEKILELQKDLENHESLESYMNEYKRLEEKMEKFIEKHEESLSKTKFYD